MRSCDYLATEGGPITLRTTVMSSNTTRRQSRSKVGRNKAASPPMRTGIWRPGWTLGLVFALLSIAAAVWLGTKFWNGAAKEQGGPPAAAQDSAIGMPAGDRSARAERRAENNEAFNTKVNRGNKLLSEDKPEDALQVLTEAEQMNPADEDVHYDLGLALTRVGKIDEAIQQYNEALRILPDYVEAHNNLGNLLMRKQQLPEAIQHFESAIKIMPEYASAQNNLGAALQKTGRTNEAILHFERAVKINPNYWQAHFNVASSYFAEGRLTEARSELETVLRLQPDFRPAKAVLAEINARQAR